jgi:hypothetical protein
VNTGEIILNIVLAVGSSALIATCMVVVPNCDRIQFMKRSRFVALEGRAQRTASNRPALAGLRDEQRENAGSALEVSLAE